MTVFVVMFHHPEDELTKQTLVDVGLSLRVAQKIITKKTVQVREQNQLGPDSCFTTEQAYIAEADVNNYIIVEKDVVTW